MSHSTTETLVKMANQIGDFFGTQRHADGAAGVADHIKKFWDPRMRAGIMEHVAHGGAGLSSARARGAETAREAPKQLRRFPRRRRLAPLT